VQSASAAGSFSVLTPLVGSLHLHTAGKFSELGVKIS